MTRKESHAINEVDGMAGKENGMKIVIFKSYYQQTDSLTRKSHAINEVDGMTGKDKIIEK